MSLSDSEGEVLNKSNFVDPLGVRDEDVDSRLQQKPRSASAGYHDVDVSRPAFVPPHRLHELPQWCRQSAGDGEEAVHYVHTSSLPQWRTGLEAGRTPAPKTKAVAKATASDLTCVTCRQLKEKCSCSSCCVCSGSVGKGSRHHCRKCWKATCSTCRKRQRHLNPMSWVNTEAPVCDDCAVLRGLARLTEDRKYRGIALLREAMDAPLQCIDRRTPCDTFTYRKMCPNCALPTVPSRPNVDRLVRVDYCCTVGRKCGKCANAEQRMRQFERASEQARLQRLPKHTAEDIDRVWEEALGGAPETYATAFKWATPQRTQEVVLALHAASICYEYGGYPHTALELSDQIVARELLQLRECKQDFSIIDAPGDLVFVAFPGTHDVRTAITDVKFARVTRRGFTQINEGLSRSSPSQPYRMVNGGVRQLYHYRLHEGFASEESKLRVSLTDATLRNLLSDGKKRIVFTGHSLGGALATLVTLRALEEDLATFGGRVSCVTFGAPLVGNSALATKVRQNGWTHLFTHVIARSDIVPRLLTERDMHRHAAVAIQNAVNSHIEAVRRLFSGKADKAEGRQPEAGTSSAGGKEYELSDGASPAGSPASTSSMGLTEEDTIRCVGESDNTEVDEGFTASGATSVLEKRAFDCFGEYHMLQRNVPYKATVNHLAAYNALRDGDGVKLDLGDHFLESYTRCLMWRLRLPPADRDRVPQPKKKRDPHEEAAAKEQQHQRSRQQLQRQPQW